MSLFEDDVTLGEKTNSVFLSSFVLSRSYIGFLAECGFKTYIAASSLAYLFKNQS